MFLLYCSCSRRGLAQELRRPFLQRGQHLVRLNRCRFDAFRGSAASRQTAGSTSSVFRSCRVLMFLLICSGPRIALLHIFVSLFVGLAQTYEGWRLFMRWMASLPLFVFHYPMDSSATDTSFCCSWLVHAVVCSQRCPKLFACCFHRSVSLSFPLSTRFCAGLWSQAWVWRHYRAGTMTSPRRVWRTMVGCAALLVCGKAQTLDHRRDATAAVRALIVDECSLLRVRNTFNGARAGAAVCSSGFWPETWEAL